MLIHNTTNLLLMKISLNSKEQYTIKINFSDRYLINEQYIFNQFKILTAGNSLYKLITLLSI